MSDHASPTARVIPSDHSVHADHNFPWDRADQTVRTDPSDHPDRTARAVHRIDPRTSVLELSLEPRPIDGFDRPTSLLSQPIQHSKTDSQARFNLEREESEYVHRFSLMALLVHPACLKGCPDVLASVPDPLMETQLSEDLSHTSTHLGHENQPAGHVECLACVWIILRVSYPSHHGPARP
ncbi:hypothetical protein YC2023_060327 [Brassica napus]